MVIKHIVISGGGPSSLITYGTLKELHNRKFWKLENIQNLHGCSAGSFLSLIILLDYNWEWIDDFFIKRPWNELMDIKPEELLNVNSNLGIIDYKFMSKVISPLLEGKGLSKDITMKELYEYSGKTLHIYTCNMKTSLEKICITHKNYPNLPVYKAIYMSLTIPGICKPISDKKGFYVDGGYLCHYPKEEICNDSNINNDEVLFLFLNSTPLKVITEDTTLITLAFELFNRLQMVANKGKLWGVKTAKNEICGTLLNNDGMVNWFNLMNEQELRQKHIYQGTQDARNFLENSSDG